MALLHVCGGVSSLRVSAAMLRRKQRLLLPRLDVRRLNGLPFCRRLRFYNRVILELIFTSVMSVVAVAVIAVFFIPHWTAVFFVISFISCLYVNMLGFLYISGVQINAISYVTLVMSIGLMIDVSKYLLLVRLVKTPVPSPKRLPALHGSTLCTF